jgi:hypothetical protein
VCDETISIVDTLATLAAITGCALPPVEKAAEDSFDVSKAWLGAEDEDTLRPDLIVHSADGNFAIRRGKHKWIEGVPADDNASSSTSGRMWRRRRISPRNNRRGSRSSRPSSTGIATEATAANCLPPG